MEKLGKNREERFQSLKSVDMGNALKYLDLRYWGMNAYKWSLFKITQAKIARGEQQLLLKTYWMVRKNFAKVLPQEKIDYAISDWL